MYVTTSLRQVARAISFRDSEMVITKDFESFISGSSPDRGNRGREMLYRVVMTNSGCELQRRILGFWFFDKNYLKRDDHRKTVMFSCQEEAEDFAKNNRHMKYDAIVKYFRV